MSYILDALKKIEHEKNRKNNSNGRVSISGDLFQERTLHIVKTAVWKTILIIALVSLATSAVTWFILRGKSTKNIEAVVRQPATLPPVQAIVPVIPVPAQNQPASVVAPPVPQPAIGSVVPVKSGITKDENPSLHPARRPKKHIKTEPNLPKQTVQTMQPPADIKLSGIAWQDEHVGRRAVINGFLLKEGAVIAGAKILDIQTDRVRFSLPTGVFEIKLDAVLPAEVKK
ncbi:MAG: hypothetical protein WCI45_07075 [Desulfuromonadales bacterium]